MNIANAKPKQNNFAKLLRESTPILTILMIIIAYNNKSPIEPIKPNSSEKRVKIKSVCFSGRKSK